MQDVSEFLKASRKCKKSRENWYADELLEKVAHIQEHANNKDITMNTPYTTCKIEVCGICNMKCKFCYEKELARSNTRQKKMNIMMTLR